MDELRHKKRGSIAALIADVAQVAAEALYGPVDDEAWLRGHAAGGLHRGDFRGVNTSYLRLADKTVKELADRLGIEAPPIRWHSDPTRPGWGWVNSGRHEINVSVDAAVDWPRGWKSLHWLLAHELRHLWQYANSRFLGDRDAEEMDAEFFATKETGHTNVYPYYLRKIRNE